MGALNRVVDRVVAETVSPAAQHVAAAIGRVVSREAPLDPDATAQAASAWLVGMGPLEPLLSDPEVSDVLVNRFDEVWVERAGTLELTAVRFPAPGAVVAAVERALLPLGLRLDRMSPAVDARLPDGSRIHALIPPAAVDGPVVAIRRFTSAVLSLDDLVAGDSIDAAGSGLLADLVRRRANLIVSGATGAGKTTLLNLLSRLIPSSERVVTIEEAAELDLTGHVVRLEARPPNAEGVGEITVRSLVRHALRMRPDRIVIGEVRGPEALDLIQAMSTGHSGSMGTVHAPGAAEAMWRIETLAAMAGSVPPEPVHRMLRSAVDAIVHVERSGTRRRVRSITGVGAESLEALWQR